MSMKDAFGVVFSDINREDKFLKLTNQQKEVGNFYKTSILNYRGSSGGGYGNRRGVPGTGRYSRRYRR